MEGVFGGPGNGRSFAYSFWFLLREPDRLTGVACEEGVRSCGADCGGMETLQVGNANDSSLFRVGAVSVVDAYFWDADEVGIVAGASL